MGKKTGNGELKPYHPIELNSKHILVAKLNAAGLTNKEIAAITRYTPEHVSHTINDPRVQEIIAETRYAMTDRVDDVALRLQALASEALDKVVEQMRGSEDENIIQRSAFSILDRAGFGKVEKRIEATAHISVDAAEKLLLASQDARHIVDADYTIED